MIKDISGTELIPGNNGLDCPGNGEHTDLNGKIIECCCDECDYMLCCLNTDNFDQCQNCEDEYCPRVLNKTDKKIRKIKTFVWDSISGMHPLSNAMEVNN